jgi:hypothetical protein
MKFADIPMFPRAVYEIDLMWRSVESHVRDCEREGLDVDPDFQRAHVWSVEQQRAYIEYMLRGGEVARTVYVNAPDFNVNGYVGATLVDGKQRLEAVRAFMRGGLLVFGGHAIGDFTDSPRIFAGRLKWCVTALRSRADVLDLYLNINAGGTPHTEEEIARVRRLRAEATQ